MSNSQKKKIIKATSVSILSIVGVFLTFCIALFLAIIIQGYIQEEECFSDQLARIEELKVSYSNGEAPKLNEQDFCEFSIDDAETIKYNDLRILGSHNSYKKDYSGAAKVFTNMFFPLAGQRADASEYSRENITDQLNVGLRTFEFDIAKQQDRVKEKIVVQHSPLFDGNSWAIDFEQSIKEMVMWSNYNPNHMPVSILLEFKEDFLMKAGVSKITAADMALIEKIIVDQVGDKVMLPSTMLGTYENFRALRKDNGYKTLSQMKGKFLFVLHPGYITESQLERPIEEMKCFVGATEVDDVLFLVKNNQMQQDEISALVNANFIVRTRIDNYGDFSDEKHLATMMGGAQMISTDYPPRIVPRAGENVCSLVSGKPMCLVLRT